MDDFPSNEGNALRARLLCGHILRKRTSECFEEKKKKNKILLISVIFFRIDSVIVYLCAAFFVCILMLDAMNFQTM